LYANARARGVPDESGETLQIDFSRHIVASTNRSKRRSAVAECHSVTTAIDTAALGRWLDAQRAPGDGEQPVLSPLTGGSQNTLFSVERGGERMVIRMPGPRADAARLDGLLREIRLVRALKGTDVPHAELIAADETGDVLGQPMYVMAAVDGWNSTGDRWPAPFDTDLDARRGLAFQLVEGAAKLGRVDWRAQGLDGFGRPDGFHDRQVDRWLSFLQAYQVRELPGLDEAADWLRNHRPTSYTPGIMHGDYQFANVMYAHGAPARLAAIIDWEMTTVGDPLLDLAWALLGYDGEQPRTAGYYADLAGMPTRSELLEHYEAVSGLSTAHIDYYLVLANWKLGIVLEKTYAAAVRNGNTDSPIAAAMGPMIPDLIAKAADLARSLPNGPR
jgi:aminoglycoside phosphotransferase (APT) family kinase protein